MAELHDVTRPRDVDVLSELRALRLRIAELEELVADQAVHEDRSTRRGMLRLAGAAVVGGAAASLLGAQPAAAAAGGSMVYGNGALVQDAGSTETSITSTAGATFFGVNTSTGYGVVGSSTGSGIGVEGRSLGGGNGVVGTSIGNGKGVMGVVSSPSGEGMGLWGHVNGSSGYGVAASGGAAQLLLATQGGVGAPSTGAHLKGEVVAKTDGVYYCVAAGTPGTWRELAGEVSAGTFHAITPTRVYDSRAPLPSQGLLVSGANRLVSVADGRNNGGAVVTSNVVPAGATAVMANVTVTGTTGTFGYLAINPGNNTVVGASTINWFGAGQTLANGVGLTLNTNRQITVICDGGGSTHFIIDVSGYYL